MNDLSEFLLARIAEDEARARELQRRAQDVQLTLQDPNALGRWIPGWHDWPDVEALTARVLAKCAADRRIVEAYINAVGVCDFHAARGTADGSRYGQAAAEATVLLPTLALLALPYADHPDYREGWRA